MKTHKKQIIIIMLIRTRSQMENKPHVRGEQANFTRLVLGGGGGRPDYLQKLKVPEGYEKMIDFSNI